MMGDCWNCGSPLICDECGKAAPPDGAIRADAESVVRAERERDEAQAELEKLRQMWNGDLGYHRLLVANPRYREALERIAELSGGGEYAAEIARQALADQEKIDPGHPLACACPDCDDSRPPADQEPKR